jgi:hypothetical protein
MPAKCFKGHGLTPDWTVCLEIRGGENPAVPIRRGLDGDRERPAGDSFRAFLGVGPEGCGQPGEFLGRARCRGTASRKPDGRGLRKTTEQTGRPEQRALEPFGDDETTLRKAGSRGHDSDPGQLAVLPVEFPETCG